MSDREIPQKSPYVVELEPGNYAWCACGKSTNQPFCDGAHATTDLKPIVFRVEEKTTMALCGCKHTGADGPTCDGSHAKL